MPTELWGTSWEIANWKTKMGGVVKIMFQLIYQQGKNPRCPLKILGGFHAGNRVSPLQVVTISYSLLWPSYSNLYTDPINFIFSTPATFEIVNWTVLFHWNQGSRPVKRTLVCNSSDHFKWSQNLSRASRTVVCAVPQHSTCANHRSFCIPDGAASDTEEKWKIQATARWRRGDFDGRREEFQNRHLY